jgi:hypothetical protein
MTEEESDISPLPTLLISITVVAFISFVVFVYAAIWFQSLIFGELAGASLCFTVFFAWFTALPDKADQVKLS